MNAWVNITDITERLSELGITITPWLSGSPSKLDKLILQKQREFERKTKRNFEKSSATILVDGNGQDIIVLPNYPVNSITSIKLLGLSVGDTSDITNYRLDANTGRVQILGGPSPYYAFFPEGDMNIEVIYDYGYLAASIPADIQDAITLMCCLDVISRSPLDWEKDGVTMMKIADYSESYGAGEYYGGIFGSQKKLWTTQINEIIARFKRNFFA